MADTGWIETTGGLNMGDTGKEPSMEEILSSIKRIIAEDADGPSGRSRAAGLSRSRREVDRESHRKAVIANMVADHADDAHSYADEVLELTDEMAGVEVAAHKSVEPKATAYKAVHKEADMGRREASVSVASDDDYETDAHQPAAVSSSDSQNSIEPEDDGIVSAASEVAARTSLAALSSMVVKSSEVASGGHAATLEDLVREMLRPMLKEWLDANLPNMVEGMVAKEIARITGHSL